MNTKQKPSYFLGPKINEKIIIPKIFHLIKQNNRIFIKWQAYKFHELVLPGRCFKCLRFGHKRKYCRSDVQYCSHCSGEGHERVNCPHKGQAPKCIYSHGITKTIVISHFPVPAQQ
ncbi:hypothetical protein PR048_023741 [Dryococelus australis]|uniref:CCHC-type domain-containing protein n=1 Tax=Dryococelus australis TaxID=614101 RepID=A0ABQ9GUY1_9NEOP|nr:hypothetical protein PR048_023741 [Dryococelus australis]